MEPWRAMEKIVRFFPVESFPKWTRTVPFKLRCRERFKLDKVVRPMF